MLLTPLPFTHMLMSCQERQGEDPAGCGCLSGTPHKLHGPPQGPTSSGSTTSWGCILTWSSQSPFDSGCQGGLEKPAEVSSPLPLPHQATGEGRWDLHQPPPPQTGLEHWGLTLTIKYIVFKSPPPGLCNIQTFCELASSFDGLCNFILSRII